MFRMIEHDPIPDDVPVPDAIEQIRPVTESAELESLDIDERVPVEGLQFGVRVLDRLLHHC